jgi:hypothetical protein
MEKRFTVVIGVEIYKALKRIAIDKDISMKELITSIFNDFIMRHKNERKG